MAGSGMMMKVLCIGLLCMLMVAPHAEGDISCNNVYSTLYPCMSYAMGTAPLQASCCNGIRSLYSSASTTGDRQAVCSCLKQVASSATGVNMGNVASLPGKCGVNLPYKISPSINCAQVRM